MLTRPCVFLLVCVWGTLTMGGDYPRGRSEIPRGPSTPENTPAASDEVPPNDETSQLKCQSILLDNNSGSWVLVPVREERVRSSVYWKEQNYLERKSSTELAGTGCVECKIRHTWTQQSTMVKDGANSKYYVTVYKPCWVPNTHSEFFKAEPVAADKTLTDVQNPAQTRADAQVEGKEQDDRREMGRDERWQRGYGRRPRGRWSRGN